MNVLFKEEQRFNQVYVWVIISVVMISSGFAVFEVIANHDQLDSGSIVGLTISLLVAGSVGILFYFLKLNTRIDQDYIGIKFSPFIDKKISWKEVESASVVEYKPFREYGGWGIRHRIGKVAYSVAGKVGLKLTLNSGKIVMIGTQRKDELKAILRKLKERDQEEF